MTQEHKDSLEKIAKGKLSLLECRAVAESILADEIFNRIQQQVSVEPEVLLPERNSFGQWIDSKEKMPEKNERVLVYNLNDTNEQYSIDYRFLGADMNMHWDWNEDDDVKWMPLPKF